MVNELIAVLDQLGGEAGVGRAVRTSEDLSAAIREGFPHEAVNALASTGLSLQEIASCLDLSLRSLQRRKSQGRLARYESDRLYRLARLVSLAANFLGDRKTGIDWLKREAPIVAEGRVQRPFPSGCGAYRRHHSLEYHAGRYLE